MSAIEEAEMNARKEIGGRSLDTLAGHARLIADADRHFFRTPEPQCRFNLIGCGTMGLEHLRVTHLEGRGAIHGIYDPAPRSIERAREQFALCAPGQELEIYDTLEAACADPAVDGLIICTPNHTHIEVVRAAAASGKHILLEKPVATTVADAREIMDIAARHPAVFQVGLQYRYKAIYVEAIHEALERRSLGEIKTVSMMEHRIPFLDKVGQWNKYSRYSGGTLVEKCCHYFDLINLFAGARPAAVYAQGGAAVNFRDFRHAEGPSDILDNAQVSITYENEVRASFQLVMFAPMLYEEVVVCGDEGRLRAWENEQFLQGRAFRSEVEIHRGENGPSRLCEPAYPSVIQSSGHHGATFYEHVALMDRIAGEPSIAANAEEAFWSVVVGAAAEESVRSGEVIRIGPWLAAMGVEI